MDKLRIDAMSFLTLDWPYTSIFEAVAKWISLISLHDFLILSIDLLHPEQPRKKIYTRTITN